MSGFVILILILLASLIALAIVTSAKPTISRGGRTNRVGSIDKEFVAGRWAAIEAMAATPGKLRDAVGEADKLLDYALKQGGAQGKTMGERLRNSKTKFSNVNAVWRAHKLRNALAHEAQFDLVPSQAREAIRYFKQGLKDLGAL